MTWSSIGDMLEKKYRITLHYGDPDFPDFASYRLPIDLEKDVFTDVFFNYVDGVITMAVVLITGEEDLKKQFPNLVNDSKQAFGKTFMMNTKTKVCLVFVFFDDGEEDLAQKAMKEYLKE